MADADQQSLHIDLSRDPISSVLIQADNASAHSGFGPITRVPDVGDLRDALSNGDYTPSVTSAGSSVVAARQENGRPSPIPPRAAQARRQHRKDDVKEVLKDIFKDKRKESLPNGHGVAVAQVSA